MKFSNQKGGLTGSTSHLALLSMTARQTDFGTAGLLPGICQILTDEDVRAFEEFRLMSRQLSTK